MQNQFKTIQTSRRRNSTSRVGLKSLKDDCDNIYSTHQTNVYQTMMDALSEHNLSSSESVQQQLISTLKEILGKDEYFKSNYPDYPTPILVDRIHARPEQASQLLEPKGFNELQNLNLSNIFLETKGVFAASQNSSFHSSKVLNLSGNPLGDSGLKLIAANSNWKDLHTLTLRDIQADDLGAKYLAANESWMNLEELDLSQNLLLGNLGAMHLSKNRA